MKHVLDGIHLSQQKYVDNLLLKTKMHDAKSFPTFLQLLLACYQLKEISFQIQVYVASLWEPCGMCASIGLIWLFCEQGLPIHGQYFSLALESGKK